MKRGKKYTEAAKGIDKTAQYDTAEAISLVKKQQLLNLMKQLKPTSELAVTDVMQNSRSAARLYCPTELVRR